MKKLLLTLLSAVALMATGCEKNTESGYDADHMPFSGSWKLIYYSVGDDVRTGQYGLYTFDFKPKETITARIGQQELNGYWSQSTGASRKFSIAFNNEDQALMALNNDWEVLTVNELEVRLADNEKGEQLYFSRQ